MDIEAYFSLLGNSAFRCTISIRCPGKDADFNFEQSLLRINLEYAFGEVIRSWVILWRSLEMEFKEKNGSKRLLY